MIAAAHQPHVLPWLGYLAKIAACDLFVVMDDLQYEPQNFQNRNRVKINHGAAWLTIPLSRGPQHERICDKRIVDGWQARVWQTIKIHYGAAPYFALYAATLEDALTRPWVHLLDFCLHMLELHLDWFEIRTPVVLASSLSLSGQKTERLAAMCRLLDADTYLSGGGASLRYLDVPRMQRAGLRVMWQHFEHPVYAQRYMALGFLPNLAAIDLLLNCGPESARMLRAAALPTEKAA
jgi:hypothetical protein